MNTSKAAPATCPESSAARSASSSTSPPRAQLMMRTPFFIFAIAAASTMFVVFSVSGVCSVMKSARLNSSSSSTLCTPMIGGALGREERIVGDHPHAQAERAVDHDRADIAGADHAERLAGDLDPHEAVLLPLAGLCRRIGLRNLPREREHQRDGVFGGGDRIAERRVHHDDALRGRGRDVDIVDADAGAADHLQALAFSRIFGVTLVAERIASPSIAADDLGKLLLVRAELRLKIDLDAAILEDLHGGGRESVGNENSGDGIFYLPSGGGRRPAAPGRGPDPWRFYGGVKVLAAAGEGPRPRRGLRSYAAFGSAALAWAKAQSIHGVSASTSDAPPCAAPDAQARRRVAVRRDVVGAALLLDQRTGP